MRKLKLIIADYDKDYVQSLVRYVLTKYPEYFELHSFTKQSFLSEYLEISGERVDLLLFGKEFLNVLPLAKKPAIGIFLSEDNSKQNIEGLEQIYKYQHAEMLVTQLIAIYSGNNDNEFLHSGQRATHVIAVFSGEGGSGKTSIAAVSSMIYAKRGAKVLYLNLEGICSTKAFFNGDSGQTFSNVIYYLKENSSNLVSKMEGARCICPDTGVSFYRPPENLRDIEELLFDDVELLVNTIKRSAFYDYVFIDLSSGFMQRNLAVFKKCDTLLCVKTTRQNSIMKDELLNREYGCLNERYGSDAETKCIDIINMFKGAKATTPVNSINYYTDMEQQPEMKNMVCAEFVNDVGRLLDDVIFASHR